MRAITYSVTGAPDVLTLVDKAPTAPGSEELLVRVHRAGVNPTDWKARSGGSSGVGSGSPITPRQVPGQDGSGVVEAVGPGVDPSLVGRRVWLFEAAHHGPEGATQELAVVSTRRAAVLPDDATFDLGACLGVPFLTAHRCLTVTEEGPDSLGPGALAGRTVLVSGGAGAVGNAAIQLARWSGAEVVTTVSSDAKAALARAAGAQHVLDYTRVDVAQHVRRIAPDGVNTVVEVAAAANAAIDVAVVARHGCVAVYADDGGAPLTLPVRPLMTPNVRLQFVLVYNAPDAWKQRAVADIGEAVRQGAVRVGEEAGLPLHHLPLEDAARAHAAVQDGTVGKVLIDVVDQPAPAPGSRSVGAAT